MEQTGQTPPTEPQPPQSPPQYAGYSPPAPPPVGGYSGGYAASAPRKRMAAWKIVLIALGAILLLLGGCCATAVVLFPTATVPQGDSVAVIHVDGIIAGTGSYYDGVITPEYLLDQLDQALSDSSVKAIVLRIDSPGGTVAASQEISTEVARAAEEKPIIASIGDVGASGAYMIASQCDEIIANPTSAVGSIGVITEIPNVAGLLDKLGIEFTVLTAGEYKDAGSPFRSITPTETGLIQREVDIAYDEFIRIVSEGRGLPEDDVREMATGWAWSAIEGQEMGLVDTLGTYNDALDRAADLGGIEGDYGITYYDDYDFVDFMSSLLGITDGLDPLGALRAPGGSAAPAVPR